ncbi:MAG TPA: YihY/virulence factor BrkB family protein [Burkholderiales bacterium]
MVFFKHAPQVVKHPLAFALRVIRSFRANQGLLLAGAIAYYTLLSMVPLLILMVIALSHFLDRAELLTTVGRALEWIAPGQSKAVVHELATFLADRGSIGFVLLATLVVFSSLAFTVLENAMSVIFTHRVAVKKRHFLVSVLIPFGYIFFLGLALLLGTLVSASLDAVGKESIVILGNLWSLGGISGFLLYTIGVILEILLITSIYLVMPVGRLSLSHALIGGVTAGLLWEGIRHGLAWYFGNLSQVSLVYGSLTSAIVVLLSFEIAATLLLIGAQVIAEYERLGGPSEGEKRKEERGK